MSGLLKKLQELLVARMAIILGACLCLVLTTVVVVRLQHHVNLSVPRIVNSPNNTHTNTSLVAPASVTATAIGPNQVKLTWSACPGATKYVIYRNNTKIATTAGTTYIDSGLSATTSYKYFVVAIAGDGDSGRLSKTVTVQTLAPGSTASSPSKGSGATSTSGSTSSSPSGSDTAGSGGGTPVPPGVTLQSIDGGASYFSKWSNGFPGTSTFIPVGVYPSESLPSALASEGINFFTPMRNEQAGAWCPVWSNPNGNDMNGVNATAGFYAGGTFYQTIGGQAWGSRAAFDVFGDELDGNANNWFDCLPTNISSNNTPGTWGGLSASSFLAAEAASHTDDSTRPTYIQTTTTFIDGGNDYFYTTAQKQAICSGADIFSFDIYPLVLRGGNVWDMYDQVKEARGYCQSSRPVMAFTEMDHMNGGSTYPLPAQTVAEVWNAIIAGARGVQYFDQYGNITNTSYTGNGNYAPGAMYSAIKTANTQIASLAQVINAPFANGYASSNGTISIMAKYYNNHFYVFAIPHASGSQTITFHLTGAPNTTATVLNENRTLNVTNGAFSDTFSNENVVHIYQIN